jgi:two-component system, cell cycle sensor histidine kinase and response regulator CckA
MPDPHDDRAAASATKAGPRNLENELREVNERLLLSALREQESRENAERERRQLSALLEALHDGVVITDDEGRIVLLNDAARRVLDIPPDVVADHGVLSSLDYRNLDLAPLSASEQPFARAVKGATFVDAEILLVRSDRDVRRVSTSCTNTLDSGKVGLAITVLRDVTDRRHLEARLAQTERLASIGTLAAGVAHEINTPLSYVMGNIALVLEEIRAMRLAEASPRLDELEAMLVGAALGTERIGKIIRGLTTFARGGDEQKAVIDVRPVLDLSIDMAFNEIRHRARLVKEYGEVPLVDVDSARLGQVFVNLLVNAAHALPDGEAERNEIRIVTSTDAEGRAVIEVRDTGPGIPEEVLPRLFDPFFTTKAVGVGTGLGLSICRNSVLAMQGEIGVESKRGGGTVFRIVVPAANGLPVSPRAAMPLPTGVAARKGSVLVVDDEAAIGVVLTRVLRGHEVTAVTSANEALELIASGRTFDVILSDLLMPERSGMDLYDALAERSPRHASRVVFVSGGAFTAGATTFLERVPNERIAKPFDASTIRALVQRYVGLP